MKKYLFLAILLLAIGFGISVDKVIKERDRADRMTTNYQKADDDNKSLTLTYKEFTDVQKERIDKLTDSLNIKPKTVTKYVVIKVKDSISYPVETFVEKIDSSKYEFARDTGCFHIKGIVSILDSIPAVKITELEYNNNIEYIVYLERQQWKWWFIKSRLFGTKEAKLETISKCGESTTEEIELIKR